MSTNIPATKQAVNNRDERGRFMPGNSPTTGFHTNPERRSNGSWKKLDTPRYKLEQMMTLTESELNEMNNDPTTPLFERKLAVAMLDGSWSIMRDMINEVYGRPKETVELTDKPEHPAIIKGFVLPTAPADFIDKDIRDQLGKELSASILSIN